MKRIAIIRPEPGASATLERACEQGLDAFALPLFEIAALEWEAPQAEMFDGVLLTSANAVRHGGRELDSFRHLPAYAVGEATAEAARAAGFDIAATGDEGVEQLLYSIDPMLRLVHPCGRDRIDVQSAPQAITHVPVYESRPLSGVDPRPLDGCMVLVHSPGAGRHLAAIAGDRLTITIVAISPAAANAAGPGWADVETAEAPTDQALLALAARLCKNGRGQ